MNKRQRLQVQYLCFFSMFCLSACAGFYDVTTKSPPPQYNSPVKVESNFDISGRFSIKSEDRHKYGNFTWLKTNNYEELNFNTPLGQTVAKVVICNGVITLFTSSASYTGDDLEQVMQNNLGFVLPLAYLHYWVQGIALPDVKDTKPLAYGFRQLGWNVEYLNWYDRNHPRIIQLTRGTLTVKLVIDL